MRNRDDQKKMQYPGQEHPLVRGPDTVFSSYAKESRGTLGFRLTRWTPANDEIESLAVYVMRCSDKNHRHPPYVLRHAFWKETGEHNAPDKEAAAVKVAFYPLDENPEEIGNLMQRLSHAVNHPPFADNRKAPLADVQITLGYGESEASEWHEEKYIDPTELAPEEMDVDLSGKYRQPDRSIYIKKDEQSSGLHFCDLPNTPVTRIFNEVFRALKRSLAKISPQNWCEHYGVSPYHEPAESQRR